MSPSYITDLKEILSNRVDSEHEQIGTRLFIAACISLYLIFMHKLEAQTNISVEFVVFFALCYSFATLAVFIAVITSPAHNPIRIKLGICLDIAAATLLLVHGAETTVAVYGVYLWIIFGNGFRFGQQFLVFAASLSIAAFSTVILLNSYWQQHYAMSIGLLFWLILLPIYVGLMLKKLEQVTQTVIKGNHAKRDFLANMSHEIRTPLTAIIGFAEASLDSEQSMQERMSALKTIVRNGTHLHNIVNEILDFSKIEANKLEIEQAETSLFEIMQDVEALIKPKAQEKNISFKTEYTLPLPDTIITDPLRLKQILINLCNNAVKFTHEGFVLVKIHCDYNQQLLHLAVIDTGIGLSKKQIEKVLKPYTQAETNTSRKYAGTGLGLPLSQQLITRLGGELCISSTPGKGSCFDASINITPIDTEHLIHSLDELRQLTTEPEASSYTPTIKLAGEVLVVDDNDTNLELFTLFLRRMGVKVVTADSGLMALKYTVDKTFDLIYLDMQMPHISGLDTVKKLREIGYQHPIVALTANATEDYKALCLQAGCNDFLAKPVLRKQFQEMTAKYVQQAIENTNEHEPIFSRLLQQEPEFGDLVEKFVSELYTTQSKIELAVEAKDWDNLNGILHNLKGTAGGLGYPVLTEIAGKIEFQLVSENFEAVTTMLGDLKQICTRIFDGMHLTQHLTERQLPLT